MENNNGSETALVQNIAEPATLACPGCHGERGGTGIVGMADEEYAECETCDGAGEAVCQVCAAAPAVSVSLSAHRELTCAECGAVDVTTGKAAA